MASPRRWIRRMARIAIVLLVCWIVLAQSCMYFRTSDRKAGKNFDEAGVPLTMVYEPVSGGMVHYAKTGSDTLPTLVFIHGSPGSWDAFEQYLRDKELLQHFRMVSIDRPGFGYSNFGSAENLATQAAMLATALRLLKNGKPMMVAGHSLGGPLVLQLALDAPEVVDVAVLLAASIDPAAEKPERWRYVFQRRPLRWLLPGAFRPSNDELVWLKEDLKIMEKRLSQIQQPVYWVHGTRDMLVPFSNMAFAQQKMGPQIADSLKLEGANHFIPWSHYQEVKRFLLGIRLPL